MRERRRALTSIPRPLREKYAALGKVAEEARRVADSRTALTEGRSRARRRRREARSAGRRPRSAGADSDAASRGPPSFCRRIRGGRASRRAKPQERARRSRRRWRKRPPVSPDSRPAALWRRPIALRRRGRAARRRGGHCAPRCSAVRRLRRRPRSASASPNSSASSSTRIVWRTMRSKTPRGLAKHALETQRLDEQTRQYALAQAAEGRAAGLLAETEQGWGKLWQQVCAQPALACQDAGMVSTASNSILKMRDKLVARRTELEAKEAELRRIEPVLRGLGVAGRIERDRRPRLRPARRSLRAASGRDRRAPGRDRATSRPGSLKRAGVVEEAKDRRRRRRRPPRRLAWPMGRRSRRPRARRRRLDRSRRNRRSRFGTGPSTTPKTIATVCAASPASSGT